VGIALVVEIALAAEIAENGEVGRVSDGVYDEPESGFGVTESVTEIVHGVP
jgi:hypothetical protein